jgi:hypothetical protein
MSSERTGRFAREAAPDDGQDPAAAVADLTEQLERRTAELTEQLERQAAETERQRTRAEGAQTRLRKQRRTARETAEALNAVTAERDELAALLREERVAAEDALAELARGAGRITALERELRMAWHRVETLEQALEHARRPLHRRAFRRSPPEPN